jgi:hypothetical protein
MNVNPHPFVMATFARHRHEAIRAEANRDRLARLAQRTRSGHRGQHGPDLLAATAVTLALFGASVVAAGAPGSLLAQVSEAAESITSNLLASEDSETAAVQKVREAAQVQMGAAEPAADTDLAKAIPKLILGKITLTDILVS